MEKQKNQKYPIFSAFSGDGQPAMKIRRIDIENPFIRYLKLLVEMHQRDFQRNRRKNEEGDRFQSRVTKNIFLVTKLFTREHYFKEIVWVFL